MSRRLTDEFVWLRGGRVASRKPKGQGEFVMSSCPLLIESDRPKFDITMHHQGAERHMQAVRFNHDIVCWEA